MAAEAVAEAVASNEAAKAEDLPAATELPAAVAETDATPQAASVAQATESEKPSSRDAEVMAAIASLAPSNGQGSESTAPASGANGTGQEVAVGAASVAAAEAAITGPRWIAESVAVAVEESAATLDQEMERASAARGGRIRRSDLALRQRLKLPTPAPAVEAAEPVIAEAVSVTEAVAAAEPVPASMAAETSSVESPAVQEIVQAGSRTGARGGEGRIGIRSRGSGRFWLGTRAPVEAISSTTVSPEISENVPVASVEVAPQREAELAAAWQNWKQIRESFVSTPASAPVAEAPAAETSAPQSVSQEDASASPQLQNRLQIRTRNRRGRSVPPLRHRESPPRSPASSIPCWPS